MKKIIGLLLVFLASVSMAALILVCTQVGSSFSPTDISGLILWLDASDNTKVTLSGSLVTAWNDKSNTGLNFSSASTFEPTYLTADLNGKNTIQFGASKCMTAGNTQLISDTSGNTLAYVAKPTSASNFNTILNFYNPTASISTNITYDSVHIHSGFDFFWGSAAGNFHPGMMANLTSYLSAYKQYILTFSGSGSGISNYTLTFDSTSQSLSAPSSGDLGSAPNANVIGANTGSNCSSYLNGNIAEILIYNSVLSGANLSNIESYFTSKWGV